MLKARFVLIAVLACALAGCWEEIHYTAPPPGVKSPAAPAVTSAPAELPDETADFGDDVAASLAEPPAPKSPAPETAGEAASAVGEPATASTTPTPTSPTLTPPPPTEIPAEPLIAGPAAEPIVETPPNPTAARSPRRMAWLLGSNLSLAALANDRAADPEKIADWFDKSQRLAELLGTTVADLPPRPDAASPNADRAIEYLFGQGQAIGRHLAAKYGDDHSAIFELAVKSNILLVLYQPGAPVVKSLSVAIEQSGERAALPAQQLQPLLKLLAAGTTPKEVRDALYELHANVDRYLSSEQP